MTVRMGKWQVLLAAAGVLALGLGVFLVRVGLENADHWASVFGLFVGLFGAAAGVYSARQSADQVRNREDTSTDGTRNWIKRGTFGGPVLLGRDLEAVNMSGGPQAGHPAEQQPDLAAPASGDTVNTIDDGQFQGPVFMVRDIRRIDLAPPGGAKPGKDGAGSASL